MKRTWPIIAVSDVQASSRWYRELLDCKNNHPDDGTFDQLQDIDGTTLLCLHKWAEHEHPSLMAPEYGKPGNGLLLFFCVDNFDDVLARARNLPRPVAEEPRTNPNTRALEFSLLDPDGYFVTFSAFDATPSA